MKLSEELLAILTEVQMPATYLAGWLRWRSDGDGSDRPAVPRGNAV